MIDHADGIGLSGNDEAAMWLAKEVTAILDGDEVAALMLIVVGRDGRLELRQQATDPMSIFKQVGIYQAAIHKALAECDL